MYAHPTDWRYARDLRPGAAAPVGYYVVDPPAPDRIARGGDYSGALLDRIDDLRAAGVRPTAQALVESGHFVVFPPDSPRPTPAAAPQDLALEMAELDLLEAELRGGTTSRVAARTPRTPRADGRWLGELAALRAAIAGTAPSCAIDHRTELHEAGHVLVAYALGAELRNVHAIAGRKEGVAGEAHYVAADTWGPREDCAVSLAGTAAVRRKSGAHDPQARHDLHAATARLIDQGTPAALVDDALACGLRMADAILTRSDYAAALDFLAGALARSHEIAGGTLTLLLDRRIAEPRLPVGIAAPDAARAAA